MARIPPYPCALCGNPVLGLIGQDAELPAYAIGLLADEAAADATSGWAHVRCLVAASLEELWTRRLTALRTQVPGTRACYERPGLVVLEHEATGERIVIDRGSEARIPATGQKLTRSGAGTVALVLEHELNLDLSGNPDLTRTLRKTFAQGGRLRLADLVEALSATPWLATPEAIADGTVRAVSEPGVTMAELADGALCGVARYQLILDADCAAAFEPGEKVKN